MVATAPRSPSQTRVADAPEVVPPPARAATAALRGLVDACAFAAILERVRERHLPAASREIPSLLSRERSPLTQLRLGRWGSVPPSALRCRSRASAFPVAKLSQNPNSLTCFGICFERKQIPRIVGNLRKRSERERRENRVVFAQGRCATRLRYAPTPIAWDFSSNLNRHQSACPKLSHNDRLSQNLRTSPTPESLGF